MNELEVFIQLKRVIRDNSGIAIGILAPVNDFWVTCDRHNSFEVFDDRATARAHIVATTTIH